MPWKVCLHATRPVVITTYTGMVSPAELSAAIAETIRLMMAHQTLLLLADCRALEGGHTLFDLFSKVEAISAGEQSRGLKEALLLPSNAASVEKVQFWETACANRGLNVRIFPDEAAGLAWLQSK